MDNHVIYIMHAVLSSKGQRAVWLQLSVWLRQGCVIFKYRFIHTQFPKENSRLRSCYQYYLWELLYISLSGDFSKPIPVNYTKTFRRRRRIQQGILSGHH